MDKAPNMATHAWIEGRKYTVFHRPALKPDPYHSYSTTPYMVDRDGVTNRIYFWMNDPGRMFVRESKDYSGFRKKLPVVLVWEEPQVDQAEPSCVPDAEPADPRVVAVRAAEMTCTVSRADVLRALGCPWPEDRCGISVTTNPKDVRFTVVYTAPPHTE